MNEENQSESSHELIASDEPPRIKITQREIQEEIADERNARKLRKRLLPRALLVGVIAGLIAAAFRFLLHVIGEWRTGFLETQSEGGSGRC